MRSMNLNTSGIFFICSIDKLQHEVTNTITHAKLLCPGHAWSRKDQCQHVIKSLSNLLIRDHSQEIPLLLTQCARVHPCPTFPHLILSLSKWLIIWKRHFLNECCSSKSPIINPVFIILLFFIRFLHLIADPVLVTTVCIPFLLIRGIPLTHALETCIHSIEDNSTWTPSALPSSCISSSELLHWDFKSSNHTQFKTYKHELVSERHC